MQNVSALVGPEQASYYGMKREKDLQLPVVRFSGQNLQKGQERTIYYFGKVIKPRVAAIWKN